MHAVMAAARLDGVPASPKGLRHGFEVAAVTAGIRYVADRDAVEIVTTGGAGFLIPRQWIGALQDVPEAELAKLEVWPDAHLEPDERYRCNGTNILISFAGYPDIGKVRCLFTSKMTQRPLSLRDWQNKRA